MRKGFHQRYVDGSYKEGKRICINCQHVYIHPDPELINYYCNRTNKRPMNYEELQAVGIDHWSDAGQHILEKYHDWQRWRMVQQYGNCKHFKRAKPQ